ncbi:hypothetical protein SAMN05878482_11063 [Peribacillus simplex]|uniref:Uncharacterized protein n=1 Tax=Peribacillus simplex TaxID=1478 RepID=A0A9X8RDW5_9BACI|nr:hypothetical protein SAMN05878482_11063 [Peribacillus simplex]
MMKSVAFSINEESIAKQIADECGGNIVVRNAKFEENICQVER